MSWDLDFRGDNIEALEAGGRLPPGFYVAKVDNFAEDQKDGAGVFTFLVSAGPFAGQKTEAKLFNPKFADTAERAANAVRRAKVWAARLGLVGADDLTKIVPLDFRKAVNHNCVLKMETDSYEDRSGVKRETVKVGYMGVYPLDHPDIPEDFRMAMNLGPARPRKPGDGKAAASAVSASGTGTQAPAAAVQNTADIAKSLFG